MTTLHSERVVAPQRISYAFESAPAAGAMVEIAPGLNWLRMPLPFKLTHINLWLLADGPGWTVVDTGLFGEASIDVWKRLLTGPLAAERPTRVLVTHMHPDHAGMAGWLCRECNVPLWMPRAEYLMCRALTAREAPAPPSALEFYRAAGFPEQALGRYADGYGYYRRLVTPPPDAYRRIEDGERIAIGDHLWEVVVGTGHSPEHACLYCAELNVLISGDQILPTISSNVSLWPIEPDADPLHDWLESCRALAERLPADVLVLPAHGRPFRGAHVRLRQLMDEHHRGLDELLALCAEPKSAIEVFPALFKSPVDERNLIMAAGEALAHLQYLARRGKLRSELGPDRVRRYRTIGSPG